MKVLANTNKYKISLFGDNVTFTTYPDGVEVELEDMKEIVDIELKAVGYKPFYSITDFRDMFGNMSNETKEFLANNEDINRLKELEILIVNSLPIKILTRGYLMVFKPKTETIIISKEDELLEVLEKRGLEKSVLEELTEFFQ